MNINIKERKFLIQFGRRVAAVRRGKTFTQEKLGILSTIGEAAVSRLERGLANPTLVTLKRICDVLDVDIEELFPA